MILTKNKPLDLALGSHGLSLNSTNWGVNRQNWKGTEEKQGIDSAWRCLFISRGESGESDVESAVGGDPRERYWGVGVGEGGWVWREWRWIMQGLRRGSQWRWSRNRYRRQAHFVKCRKKAEWVQKRASLIGWVGIVKSVTQRELGRKSSAASEQIETLWRGPAPPQGSLFQAGLRNPGARRQNESVGSWDWQHEGKGQFYLENPLND